MAHPDDLGFLCAGTLRLLVEAGCEVRCVALSGGDMGAPERSREAIRAIRLREAESAAPVLGGGCAWAGLEDLSIHYSPERGADAERRACAAPAAALDPRSERLCRQR